LENFPFFGPLSAAVELLSAAVELFAAMAVLFVVPGKEEVFNRGEEKIRSSEDV